MRTSLFLPLMILALAAPVSAADLPSHEQVRALITDSQEWFLAQQQDDGSLMAGDQFKLGATALALEALLSGPQAVPVADPRIQKALAYVAKHQQDDGGIYDPNEGLENYITSLSLMIWSSVGDADAPTIDIEKAQNKLLGLQNVDEKDINFGGIGYGSKGPTHEDLNNTTYAVEALRRSGIPSDHPAMQRALKFVQRCQNRSESNDLPWAGNSNDGGAVYAPHESKAGGSWTDEEQQKAAAEKAAAENKLGSYGSMTYNLISTFIILDLPKDDPRLLAALNWAKKNYQFEVNPGMPEGQEMEGLLYYYQMMATTFDELDISAVNQGDWRADLFAQIDQRKIPAESGGVFWSNSVKRWAEAVPQIASAYMLKSLKRIDASLE
ncbi:MAG: terpene cyclase/mutase family protein [Planctomycetota bacterium]|jgi:squalene-hopene/tetraprenyl-beta-curcumene cyclase|nr:terpene cyclase/mutase family protein [Planctomycetota bacterium]